MYKFSNKKWLGMLILTVCLSSTFAADEYAKAYKTLRHVAPEKAADLLIDTLKDENWEIFNAPGIASTPRLLARRYLTSEIMKLSGDDFAKVITAAPNCFKDLFGKSLILGWALYKADEDLSTLFARPLGDDYSQYFIETQAKIQQTFVDMVEDPKLITDCDLLIDKANHYRFYFHSIHLAWPAGELRDEEKRAKVQAALKPAVIIKPLILNQPVVVVDADDLEKRAVLQEIVGYFNDQNTIERVTLFFSSNKAKPIVMNLNDLKILATEIKNTKPKKQVNKAKEEVLTKANIF